MRYLILVIALLSSICLAQVFELPEQTVVADSPIKAYLYKKTLTYSPSHTAYDSLPPFLAPLKATPSVAPIYNPSKSVKILGELNADTNGDLAARISHYPVDPNFKAIVLDYAPTIDNAGYKAHRLNLDALITTRAHTLSPALELFYSRADGFHSSNYKLSLSHYTRELDLGRFAWTLPSTELAIDLWDQQAGAADDGIDLLLSHQSRIDLYKTAFDLQFTHYGSQTAVNLAYHLPQQRIFLEDIKLGLITDFKKLAPSISMKYKPILGKYEYLELGQTAGIVVSDHFDQLDSYTWIHRPDKPRIPMEILNLRADYFKMTPQNAQLKDFHLEAVTSYTLGKPTLYDDLSTSVPGIIHTDQFALHLGGGFSLEAEDAVLKQQFDVNLCYLPEHNYRRLPYKELLSSTTELDFYATGTHYLITLFQNYGRLDSNWQKLPEDVDLNFTIDRAITEELHLVGGMKRIFGSKATDFAGLPMRGRELWAQLKYYY